MYIIIVKQRNVENIGTFSFISASTWKKYEWKKIPKQPFFLIVI